MVATALDDNAGIFGVREPSRTLTRRVQPIRAARAIRRLVADKDDTEPVSYTHLTLPTIDSV